MNDFSEVLGTVAMVPKGEYDSTAYYEYLNVVEYEGSTYMAKKNVNNVLPTDEEYWQFIAGGVTKEDTAIVFDTVADMKSSEILKDGMTVQTLGYYEVNDGGGATYKITDEVSETEYQEEVGNLYATLIANKELNSLQFGIENESDITDFLKLISNLNIKKITLKNGTYYITDTVVFNKSIDIDFDNSTIISNCDNETLLFESTLNKETSLSSNYDVTSQYFNITDDEE